MTTDFRSLCAELTKDLELLFAYGGIHPSQESHDLIDHARAALAEPEQPADGEVAELVAALTADAECVEVEHYDLCNMTADQMRRAADLLERLAPQPEPEGPSMLRTERRNGPWGEWNALITQPMPEEQTPAEYNRRLTDAAQAAGVGDYYWNERFLSALRNRGLALSVLRPANDHNNQYPNGAPMLAPQPHPVGDFNWPLDSLVIWSQPVPEPPADREVAELVAWLREIAQLWEPDAPRAKQLFRAADLLERLASPACVVLKPSPELIAAFKAAGYGRIESMERLAPQPQPEEPSDEELLELSQFCCVSYLLSDGTVVSPFEEGTDMRSDVLSFARAVLARWGTPNLAQVRSSLGAARD